MGNKKDIIEEFTILSQYRKLQGDHWSHQAYDNVISALKRLPIDDITNIKQVKDVSGIGLKSVSKINEYLQTGSIKAVDEARYEMSKDHETINALKKQQIVDNLSSVLGAGPITADKWWNKGIKSIKDLTNHPELLTHQQKIGVKYYKDLHKRIPRDYIDTFGLMVEYVLAKKFGIQSFNMEIAGSYRRKASSSGDIDILVTSKTLKLKNIVNELIRTKIITDVISMKDEKFMGIAHCPNGQWYHFHLDIVFVEPLSWGAALLYFTGSKGFNILIRQKAKNDFNYTLNQRGLYDENNEPIPVFTEKDILEEIGMEYIDPENR
tara:strand:- start:208 stop:1173 length:966 start_codon:yes stop_codon:yes gene_type:complete